MKYSTKATLLLCFLLSRSAFSYQASGRRAFLRGIFGSSTVGIVAASFSSPAHSVISSKYCASGKGEGCEDLSEGNELIRALQEKSAANAEKNAREARNAFYMKNYPDWFQTVGKSLVMKPDGSFIVVDDAELEQLKRENKIGVEIPRTKGGQFVDLTQKPIMVLKE